MVHSYQNGNITEYGYNDLNQLIKETRYVDSEQRIITYNYIENLLESEHTLLNNDTIYWKLYYYNDDSKTDSIIGAKTNIYYHYSPEIDSVIMQDSFLGFTFTKEYYKYLNNQKVYEEIYHFAFGGDLAEHSISTWEYNNSKLFVRCTYEQFDISGYGSGPYYENRLFYNESNKLIRSESYRRNDILQSYIVYNNDDPSMVISYSYFPDGEMRSYSINETNCENQANLVDPLNSRLLPVFIRNNT